MGSSGQGTGSLHRGAPELREESLSELPTWLPPGLELQLGEESLNKTLASFWYEYRRPGPKHYSTSFPSSQRPQWPATDSRYTLRELFSLSPLFSASLGSGATPSSSSKEQLQNWGDRKEGAPTESQLFLDRGALFQVSPPPPKHS